MSEFLTMQTQLAIKKASSPVTSGLLQRACACGRHTSSNGGECEECKRKREGTLQRSATNSASVSEVPPIVHEVLRSSGQPLDPQTRSFMEPRFGQDFSGVRVHTDAKAEESARAVNALAYTAGRDVVFGAGQYTPQTHDGLRLVAHELTHVVQQRADTTGLQRQSGNEVVLDPIEQVLEEEADEMAEAIMGGEDTEILLKSTAAVIQRQTPGRQRRRRPRAATVTRGGTVFHPGVSHNHSPTGRWADIQAASQRDCTVHAGQVEEEIERQGRGIADDILRGRIPHGRPPARGSARAAAGVGIECSCAQLSPLLTLEAARHATMTTRGLTLASQHVTHFIGGSGADFPENIEDIIRRDSGVRSKLIRAMQQHSRGHIRVGQGDYAVTDFQFAFGAIDRMDYEIDWASSTVHIWFMDRYEWHPVGFGYTRFPDDGRGRISNCVHAAAVELKASGAADYWMIGDGVVSLSLFPGVRPPRRRRP